MTKWNFDEYICFWIFGHYDFALVYGLVMLWREVRRLRSILQQLQVTQLLEPLVTRLTTSEQEIHNVRNTYRNCCQHIDEAHAGLTQKQH